MINSPFFTFYYTDAQIENGLWAFSLQITVINKWEFCMQILRPRPPRRVQGINWTNAATIKITHVLILLTLIEYGRTNITGLRTQTIRLFDTRVYIASLHVSDLKTQSWDSDIYNSIIISWRHCYIDMTLCYVRLDKCITCRHSIKPNAQWWCHQNTPAYRLPDVTGWGST